MDGRQCAKEAAEQRRRNHNTATMAGHEKQDAPSSIISVPDEYEEAYESRTRDQKDDQDVFGNESHHGIRYRTLTWPLVAVLMITEVRSRSYFNGIPAH